MRAGSSAYTLFLQTREPFYRVEVDNQIFAPRIVFPNHLVCLNKGVTEANLDGRFTSGTAASLGTAGEASSVTCYMLQQRDCSLYIRLRVPC